MNKYSDSCPLISIVVPVYKAELFINDCIDSVLKQTYKNFELILVDDGSPDKCGQICDAYAERDARIKVIHQKNSGVSFARNNGILSSKGRYIAFLDADDICSPVRLEMQYKCMINNDIIACASHCTFFGDYKKEYEPCIDDFEYYRCCLIFRNDPSVLPSTLMIESEIVKKILFDEKIHFAEDYKFLVQLTELGKIIMIKQSLVFYRKHADQSTKKRGVIIKNDSGAVTAMDYIFEKLNLTFSAKEREHFLDRPYSKVDLVYYKKVLNKIIICNREAHYYDEVALKKRCDEQWEFIILRVNNLFVLLKGLILSNGGRKKILTTKIKQLKKKIF